MLTWWRVLQFRKFVKRVQTSCATFQTFDMLQCLTSPVINLILSAFISLEPNKILT